LVLNCTNLLDVHDSWKQGERDNRHIERSAKKTRDSQLPVLMITTHAAIVILQVARLIVGHYWRVLLRLVRTCHDNL
jgi:hypothetical protein